MKDPSQYNAESEFPGIEPEAVNSADICFFEEVQNAVLTQFYVMIIFECVLNYGVLEEIFSALLVWLGSFFFLTLWVMCILYSCHLLLFIAYNTSFILIWFYFWKAGQKN